MRHSTSFRTMFTVKNHTTAPTAQGVRYSSTVHLPFTRPWCIPHTFAHLNPCVPPCSCHKVEDLVFARLDLGVRLRMSVRSDALCLPRAARPEIFSFSAAALRTGCGQWFVSTAAAVPELCL